MEKQSSSKNKIKVIVNADDLGFTEDMNVGIEKAHKEGIVRSTSLMSAGSAFKSAVEVAARNPDLAIGVHLSLFEGKPLTPPEEIPSLVDRDGNFRASLMNFLKDYQLGKIVLSEAKLELIRQVNKIVDAGITPSHIDSHKHIHLLPALMDIVLELAEKHNIPAMRLVNEGPFELSGRGFAAFILRRLSVSAAKKLNRRGVLYAHNFIGFMNSGSMTEDKLLSAIQTLRPGINEIMCHPAVRGKGISGLEEMGCSWAKSYAFEDELKALTSPKVKDLINERGIELTSWGRISS